MSSIIYQFFKKEHRGTDKKKARFLHAKNRARHRYNIDYTEQMEKQFLQQIQHNRTKARRQSNTKAIHVVSYRNKNFAIVYDRKEKSIITFLPGGVDILH